MGKLLVILAAVHWNNLNGSVIVFSWLVQRGYASIYLHVLLTRTLFVVTHFPNPPSSRLRMKNPFWALGAGGELLLLLLPVEGTLLWFKQQICTYILFFSLKRMDSFHSQQRNKCMWSYQPSIHPHAPLLLLWRLLLWEYINGNVQQLRWTQRISVWTESHMFAGSYEIFFFFISFHSNNTCS